jgi:hypothetical protein
MERKLFLVLFALGLNSNLCGDSWLLMVNLYAYKLTKNVGCHKACCYKPISTIYLYGVRPSKNVISKMCWFNSLCLIKTVVNGQV